MFDTLHRTISKTVSGGADFVEARYDDLLIKTLVKENGRLSASKAMKRAGIGFTVYCDGATGYSFTASLDQSDMDKAAIDALGIAKASAPAALIKTEILPREPITNVHLTPQVRKPAWEIELVEKLALIDRMEASAEDHGKEISSTMFMYGELSGEKYFANSEGTEIHWHPHVLDLRSVVTSKTPTADLVRGSDGIGGSFGLEYLELDGKTPEDLGRNAALWAKEQLDAKPAPAGEYRALCENTLVGVLAHESFGHLTEADFVVTRGSPLHDKVGETLGSEHATIIDEGTPEGSDLTPFWLPYDDQGTKTERTVLLEKGELKGFLHSRSTAKMLGVQPTGNARAVNFTFSPIPRMKNTYFTPGDLTEEEALEQLGTGIYAIRTSGGQVDMDGSFLFKAVRGYWVENGEKVRPLRDVTLTGNILKLLHNIEGATKDLEVTSGYFGGCGKGGQFPLPVGLGGPKLLIDNVRFGGES